MRGPEVFSDQLHNATVLPLPTASATSSFRYQEFQVFMRGLFQNRFRRSSHVRRLSSLGSPVTSLEKLEPRLAMAGDVARPLLEPASSLYMDASMFGPKPVVMTKSQVDGDVSNSFVISNVPAGSVVEKWNEAKQSWEDVSTKPTSSNPRELLKLLQRRLIQKDDKLRWIPKRGADVDVTRAFEMIGWNGGSGSTPATPSPVMGAVEDLLAVETGQDQVTFAWYAPAEEVPTAYKVMVDRESGATTTQLTSDPQLAVDGRLSDPIQKVTVTPINDVGMGDPMVVDDVQMVPTFVRRGGLYNEKVHSTSQSLIADKTPTFEGRTFGDVTSVRVVLNGEVVATVPVTEGSWRYTVPAESVLNDGVYTLTVLPVDSSSAVGVASRQFPFTISTVQPTAPTFDLADESDSGTKGDGQTAFNWPALSGVADPDTRLLISIYDTLVRVVQSNSETGEWEAQLPWVFNGTHKVVVQAVSDSGVLSEKTEKEIVVDGVRTVMLDATDGAVELMASHVLGRESQGFVVTKVINGQLEKWSEEQSSWQPIPNDEVPPIAATVESPALSRKILFTDRVRWTPLQGAQGMSAAFDVVPLGVPGGIHAPVPTTEDVPGLIREPRVAEIGSPLTEINWSAPTLPTDVSSMRYSVEVTQWNGKTALYNLPTGTTELTVDAGERALRAKFWAANNEGAGGVRKYDAKDLRNAKDLFRFSMLNGLSVADVSFLSRNLLALSPTPVQSGKPSFVLNGTHSGLAYLEVSAVPDATEAALGLEAGTSPVVSYESNLLSSDELAALKKTPFVANQMFPGTVDGDIQPDQARVFFQAGESLKIAGNVDPSIREGASVIIEEAPILGDNSFGNWHATATVPVSEEGAYSYEYEVKYGMSAVRVLLKAPLATIEGDVKAAAPVTSTPIVLTDAYNAFGITTHPWQAPNHQGFDGNGNYYNSEYSGSGSSTPVDGTPISFNGLTFPIGPIPTKASQVGGGGNSSTNNPFNFVRAAGQTIDVDVSAEQSQYLYLAGAGANGDQLAQQITLNFEDGSTETWTQSFTDWSNNGSSKKPIPYKGEHVILSQAERINQQGNLVNIPSYVYSYGYKLHGKKLSSITLPNNSDLGILSAVVADAPKVEEAMERTFLLGHMNLSGVDLLNLTIKNESNIGTGGGPLTFNFADQPVSNSAGASTPTYSTHKITVPMGEERSLTWVGTNGYSQMNFYVTKPKDKKNFLVNWKSGKGSHDNWGANISPSLNSQVKSGQKWTLTVQNAGLGYWGFLDSAHGTNLPSASKKYPAGAQMHIETAAEAKAQPPWAVAVEEVVGEIVGVVVISVATAGLADVAVGAAVGGEVVVDSGAAVSEELVSSVIDVTTLDDPEIEIDFMDVAVEEDEGLVGEGLEFEQAAEIDMEEWFATQPALDEAFQTVEVIDDEIVSSSFETDTIITDSDVSMEVDAEFEEVVGPDTSIFDQISEKLSEWAAKLSSWYESVYNYTMGYLDI